MTGVRLYGTVAACAAVVYVGALWNQFAMDDNQIVAFNKLVLQFSGVWRAFVSPYWPPVVGGGLYRPLPLASYAIDRQLGGAASGVLPVDIAWHGRASV